jgi:hypothetical protein
MVRTVNPQLVFVHGIGGLRHAEAEGQQWLTGPNKASGRADG